MTEHVGEESLRSDEAERALLGALLLGGPQLADVLARLPGDDFYNPHRGYVWDACRALSEAREPVDPTRIGRRLAAAGRWTTSTRAVVNRDVLTAADPTLAARHADLVYDLARRRELFRAIRRAEQITRDHPGDVSEVLTAVRVQFDAITTTHGGDRGALDWDALADEFREVHAPDVDTRTPPIETPWPILDDLLGGLFPGRMYVIGGRPGSGKSSAALCLAGYAAIQQGRPTLVVSREMPTVDITGRILARALEIPLHAINSRRLTRAQLAEVEDFWRKVGRPPLAVDARPRTLSGVKALARQQSHEFGLDLLVVDYLQLVRADAARTREQEVAQVSMELKSLAMELGCAVVVPAQLNRGVLQRAESRPVMSDLRDSGQIEQDADVVILLHRERPDGGGPVSEIEFIVDKNRHGATETLTLRWDGAYGAIA